MQRENHPKKTQLKEFAPVTLMYNKQAHAYSAGFTCIVYGVSILIILPVGHDKPFHLIFYRLLFYFASHHRYPRYPIV